MNNGWNATEEQIAVYVPMLREFIERTWDDPDLRDALHFCWKTPFISPHQLRDILEDRLGFEFVGMDRNGWQMDFWMYFQKDGREYMIDGCGMAFDMSFRRK